MSAHLITRDEDDDRRHVLAVGHTKGGSPLPQTRARFGDIQATGTRPEKPAAEDGRTWEASNG